MPQLHRGTPECGFSRGPLPTGPRTVIPNRGRYCSVASMVNTARPVTLKNGSTQPRHLTCNSKIASAATGTRTAMERSVSSARMFHSAKYTPLDVAALLVQGKGAESSRAPSAGGVWYEVPVPEAELRD